MESLDVQVTTRVGSREVDGVLCIGVDSLWIRGSGCEVRFWLMGWQ